MPQRILFDPGVRAQLRAIDRVAAMRVLLALNRLLETGEGNLKNLEGYDPPQTRLRVGKYRVRFRYLDGAIRVLAIGHRRQAYR